MLHAMIKAPVAGFFVTLIICLIVFWLEGSDNALLVYEVTLSTISFYWSWIVFLGSTLVCFGVMWMTDL